MSVNFLLTLQMNSSFLVHYNKLIFHRIKGKLVILTGMICDGATVNSKILQDNKIVRFRRAILTAPGFNSVDSAASVVTLTISLLQNGAVRAVELSLLTNGPEEARRSPLKARRRSPIKGVRAVKMTRRGKSRVVGRMRLVFIFSADRIETPTSQRSPSGFAMVRSSGVRQPAFSHAYTSLRSTVAAADGRAQDSCTVKARRGAGRDEIARQLQRRARIIAVLHTARRQLRYSALTTFHLAMRYSFTVVLGARYYVRSRIR